MRLYKFLFILFFLSSPVIFQSCTTDIEGVDGWTDPDYNTDPNNPPDVTMDLLLSSAQGAMAYVNGGDLGRYSSVWIQHHAGIDRQHAGIDQYRLTEADVNNAWRFSLYGGGMNALYAMLNKANENGSPHYAGVGKIMMAMFLGVTTDLWGDIPYSQAFQGLDNLTPTYDSQEQIYNTIDQLLNEAIADLSAASSLLSPDGDDLLYDLSFELNAAARLQLRLATWKKVANTLKARYAIHLSGVNGASAYNAALAAIDAGAFESNADDLEFTKFGTSQPEQNPWRQFDVQRGDIAMGEFFVDLMKSINDPRIVPFTSGTVDRGTADEPNVDYFGSPAGSPNTNSSLLGAYYASATSPVPLATYVEAKFIEAEAAFMTGDLERAATAHNAAIIASLNKFGVYNQAYVDDQAAETSGSISLEKIMTHKYVALYTQVEAYNDWRRTGIPALVGAANTNGNIPIRFPYPQSERLYNESNMPSSQNPANLQEPVWWDM